jgi:hypothetical protein
VDIEEDHIRDNKEHLVEITVLPILSKFLVSINSRDSNHIKDNFTTAKLRGNLDLPSPSSMESQPVLSDPFVEAIIVDKIVCLLLLLKNIIMLFKFNLFL